MSNATDRLANEDSWNERSYSEDSTYSLRFGSSKKYRYHGKPRIKPFQEKTVATFKCKICNEVKKLRRGLCKQCRAVKRAAGAIRGQEHLSATAAPQTSNSGNLKTWDGVSVPWSKI